MYIELLKTVSACERVDALFQKQVFDAYFLNAVSIDMLNGSEKELEIVDNLINLIANDENDVYSTPNEIKIDPHPRM